MIKFEIVDEKFRKYPNVEIKLPVRKTEGSAGYDIFSPIDIEVPSKGEAMIWSDVKAIMPYDKVFEIYIRSSLAIKYDLQLKNCVGIIDADFANNIKNDGNIGICLINNSIMPYQIKAGDSIAQGIFKDYYKVYDDVPLNKERVGGTGSTGK